MVKNQNVILEISDISQEGAGIGHVQDGPDAGYTVFVKDTVPGDTVRVHMMKVKKRYGFGRLLEVLHPSADRVEPRCEIAARCGGCQLQMMSYPAQLRMKTEKVRNDLNRIGGFADSDYQLEPIVGAKRQFRYRNKALVPFSEDRNGEIVCGFYAGRTHAVIPCTDCLLGAPENGEILTRIKDWMKQNKISAYDERTGRGLVRHVLIRKAEGTGEIIVCLIVNGRRVPAAEELVQRLSAVPGVVGITWSSNREQTNVALTGPVESLWGQSYVTDILRSEEFGISVKYQISPASFYQVNHEQTEKLYQKVLELADLKGSETVMDLYCGIGTISLFLAAKAGQVIGVEIVPEAVADARRNAELNGFSNVRFYEGKAEEVVPRLYQEESARADVVVVDPPRKGCDEKLLETIVQMNPAKLIYVSCDPATLARDLQYLRDNGFSLHTVQPFDQFANTIHVETVVLMSRVKD